MGEEIAKLNKNCSLYGIRFPRTDLRTDANRQGIVAELATEIVKEIKSRIKNPIILYGKCIAAGLALESCRRLEEESVVLRGICLGGSLPMLQLIPEDQIFIDDQERFKYLREVGAYVPNREEDQVIFSQHLRFDIIIGTACFDNMFINLKNKTSKKLKTPLYCIIGTIDPATIGYKKHFKDWLFYAERVHLILIENVGHYFSQDKPKDLAIILNNVAVNNITKRNSQAVSSFDKFVFFVKNAFRR